MAHRYPINLKLSRIVGLTLEEFFKEPIADSSIEFVRGSLMSDESEWHYTFACKQNSFGLFCDDSRKESTLKGLKFREEVENVVKLELSDKPGFYQQIGFRSGLIGMIEKIHHLYDSRPKEMLNVTIDYHLP